MTVFLNRNNGVPVTAADAKVVKAFPLKESMDAFDALPPEIRCRLASASVKITPITIPSLLPRFGVEGVLHFINRMERDTFEPRRNSNL